MTNMISSFPATNHPMPLHRHGGTLEVMSELQVGFSGDDYDLQGSGSIDSLPTYHRGTSFGITVSKGAPIFKNSAKLICPNRVDYLGKVGDRVTARSDGDGVWRLFVNPASGSQLVLRSNLVGLTLSAAGSTATFGIAAGVAADSTNVSMMSLTSAYTKTTAAWAAGSGNGSLDASTIAINTWYHVYQIQRPDTGVVDVCISTSASAPTTGGNIPAAYTLSRRIGGMKTDGSSQWTKFIQLGDEFYWDVPVTDINAVALGTTSTLYAMSVPPGLSVDLLGEFFFTNATAALLLIQSPLVSTQSANTPAGNLTMLSNTGSNSTRKVMTDISRQIRAVSSIASSTLFGVTLGWTDRRGRDI
ncbi:hypothetical protein [Tardiphaga sp. 285_C5_N1_2]|uniref:hypothetical protein n=1 Tax=Tardiphaga sp. 285_C5_N1_2 TaxID=3240775 RepID=UPI003F8C0552